MITFAEACLDPELFGDWFAADSWGVWRVIDKALFGEPLDADELAIFTEITGRTEAPAEPSTEGWFICGRRSGKDVKASALATYLATFNPLYYDPLTTPKFLTVEIQACQNHNQAMRLAKGIGMRSQPRHKLGPTVNLRGLQARHERIITINYDNTFAGDYEIATPVELDGAGIFTGFGAVPIDPSRWTLLPGEEQPKPVINGTEGEIAYPAITGENVYFSDGTIKIDFPPPPRDDATYVAEFILTSEITGSENDPWRPMSININTAVSGAVEDADYTVRYRYTTSAGNGPAWEYAAVTTSTPLPSSTNLTANGGAGQAVVAWKNPNDLRFFSSDTWRGATSNFGSATKIVDSYGGGVGQVQSITDTVGPGTWYYWNVASDGASLDAAPTGPQVATVA